MLGISKKKSSKKSHLLLRDIRTSNKMLPSLNLKYYWKKFLKVIHFSIRKIRESETYLSKGYILANFSQHPENLSMNVKVIIRFKIC